MTLNWRFYKFLYNRLGSWWLVGVTTVAVMAGGMFSRHPACDMKTIIVSGFVGIGLIIISDILFRRRFAYPEIVLNQTFESFMFGTLYKFEESAREDPAIWEVYWPFEHEVRNTLNGIERADKLSEFLIDKFKENGKKKLSEEIERYRYIIHQWNELFYENRKFLIICMNLFLLGIILITICPIAMLIDEL